MSNNKQSSVEWLFCALIDQGYKNPHDMELISIILQAKSMHMEEVIKLYNDYQDYLDNEFKNQCGGQSNILTFDQYYNKTFGFNQTPITNPDPKLIDSMAMRYRHDFGLLSDSEKESIRITMKQLWEETAGLGFYKKS